MYEELVKRLRNRRICIQQSGSLDDFPLLQEAADAIEELSKRVPKTPHGRLIDADVAEVISYSFEDSKGNFADGILFAAEWISEQPTIIPADKEEQT